jgi:hypothetical protein
MKKRTVYILVIGGLAAFSIAGVVFPNHHPHFAWDEIPGFYTLFGVAAGLALIGIALGLGNYFLWRPTWSVQLNESLVADGVTQVTLTRLRVDLKDAVKKEDPLMDLATKAGEVTVHAPLDGVVEKIFYHPEDTIDMGWTLVDLKISQKAMHHGLDSDRSYGDEKSDKESNAKGGRK